MDGKNEHEEWGDSSDRSEEEDMKHHGSNSSEEDSDEHDDDDDCMGRRMKVKIIVACIVATIVLVVLIVVIICCKKKARRARCGQKCKKNPYQTDPEKTIEKPSAKEVEAMQSAAPVQHALPIVVRPAVSLGPLPTGQEGEKVDYTSPPEDPRQQMALWSPPPAYEVNMPPAE